MSEKKPENLNVFPSGRKESGYEPAEHAKHEGMTLRDYFAAAALPAFITSTDNSYEDDAKNAYKAADAMLKVREE